MQVISIISLKGGVAKTTTAVNMAYILAGVHNKKVLVIDNDKQGNTSKAFNLYDPDDRNTIAGVMMERNIDISRIIKKTQYANVDLVTANMDLLEANLRTIVDTGRQQQTRFKKAFEAAGGYDYCIIDNAPDINMSIINALVMSDDVIVPVMIDQYSFDGLDILKEQIGQVKDDFNGALCFRGCLITQFQKNEVNLQGIGSLIQRKIPVFTQHIRRTEKKVSESTFARMPVAAYSARCGAAQDYKKFVAEYLQKTAGILDGEPNLGTGKEGRYGIQY